MKVTCGMIGDTIAGLTFSIVPETQFEQFMLEQLAKACTNGMSAEISVVKSDGIFVARSRDYPATEAEREEADHA